MGFDADADARFVFPRLASVLTVQEGDKQEVGGDNKQQRKQEKEQQQEQLEEQAKHDFALAIYHLSPFAP